MAEKLALKKALFDELRETNQRIEQWIDARKKAVSPNDDVIVRCNTHINELLAHKNFIQHLIDICVDRNKF